MICAVHTSRAPRAGLLPDLARLLRAHLHARGGRRRTTPPSTEDALVRALCHDLGSGLASLEGALGRLPAGPDGPLVSLAQAQAGYLASVLRTAQATGGAPVRVPIGGRLLRDVVASSVAASGLPRAQLTVQLEPAAADVTVGDARVQRILVNLLENAHRHGQGAAVTLVVGRRPGWVELAVRQDGLRATRVVGYLCAARPPADLTGLGLWSVQRQARELGGGIVWDDDGSSLTLRVQLPDR